ncbi:MAG: hypothetical protein J0I06_19015, partial [Planctomycetes bacterium]|nr:hypothetical protein [Planctomycetota bacterium]
TLIGLTLAIFLAFRNNASYQCYVEARALWGQALVASRAFASHLLCFAPAVSHEDRIELVKRIIAFSHALKSQLRPVPDRRHLPALEGRAGHVHRLLALAQALDGRAVGDQQQVVLGRVDLVDGRVRLDRVAVRAGDRVQERTRHGHLDALLAEPVPRQEQRQVLEPVGGQNQGFH